MSNESYSSSDEMNYHPRYNECRYSRPGCSSIQQYSHVPETSAFQRYVQSPSHSRSTEKATTSNHRSDKYRRSFTTYEGITSRNTGKRSVSVSCRNDDFVKSNNVSRKHRQSNSDVGDYKVMDTVHYLAQGEFAPRDDGIKLTPSREAVLSDIIWEDVCRTHWPDARVGRRRNPTEQNNRRSELQKLIDDLLRERVAHVERRKRKHYKSKLNARQEHGKASGKTGNIIVARNNCSKIRKRSQNASEDIITYTKRKERSYKRDHKSHERLVYQTSRHGNSTSPGTVSPCEQSFTRIEQYCQCQVDNKSKRTKEIFVSHVDSTSTSECDGLRTEVIVNAQRKQRETSKQKQYVLLSTILVHDPNSRTKKMDVIDSYRHIINLANDNDEEEEVILDAASVSSKVSDNNHNSSADDDESVNAISLESED